jgi:hypothetical protein
MLHLIAGLDAVYDALTQGGDMGSHEQHAQDLDDLETAQARRDRFARDAAAVYARKVWTLRDQAGLLPAGFALRAIAFDLEDADGEAEVQSIERWVRAGHYEGITPELVGVLLDDVFRPIERLMEGA